MYRSICDLMQFLIFNFKGHSNIFPEVVSYKIDKKILQSEDKSCAPNDPKFRMWVLLDFNSSIFYFESI